ncbi:hypothetical protein NE237_007750 [Protea cynaroides]|uniref:Uncharacterized protein n=1 Tax=Protea cynaroides TaxID=273540 RepID=A0A9Q0KQ05_9MAGN|nr:hypothetical protein NE237_007750 [Protea cynaroides]
MASTSCTSMWYKVKRDILRPALAPPGTAPQWNNTTKVPLPGANATNIVETSITQDRVANETTRNIPTIQTQHQRNHGKSSSSVDPDFDSPSLGIPILPPSSFNPTPLAIIHPSTLSEEEYYQTNDEGWYTEFKMSKPCCDTDVEVQDLNWLTEIFLGD